MPVKIGRQGRLGWAQVMAASTRDLSFSALNGGASADDRPALKHLWQVPTFFAGLLAAVITICAALPKNDSPESEMDQDLAAIRKVLAQRHAPVDPVLALAQNVLARTDAGDLSVSAAGEAHFLLGSIYLRLAEQGPPSQADKNRGLAVSHLEQATQLGVSASDLATLNYRLGKASFQSGRDPARIVAYLAGSVADAEEDPAEGYRMLSQAYLRLPVPNLEGALNTNMKLFALPIDDEKILGPARLTCGEILYQQKKRSEALKMLGSIAPDAPPALRARALYLQGRCCQEMHLWAQAIPFWEELLRSAGEPPSGPDKGSNPEKGSDPLNSRGLTLFPGSTPCPGGRGPILYFKGVCYHNLEPPNETEATKAWIQAMKYEGEDGQAAALSLADLYLSPAADGKSLIHPVGALEVYRRALAKVNSPSDYHNTLINLKKARKLLERGCDVYRTTRDYERALQLVEVYQKIAPAGVAEVLNAEIAEAWALDLKDQPRPVGPTEAADWDKKVNAQFLRAGSALQALAASRGAAEQAKLLWRSASCFLSGTDYAKTVIVLEQYLRLDVPVERRGEGWFKLAEARLALARLEPRQRAEWRDAALEAFDNATHSPGPFAYRARYQLALAELEYRPANADDEDRHLDRAKDLLWRNVEVRGESTVPADIREKSLYQLAGLFYRRRNYDEAHIRLQEAVEQYPNNPYILQAREKLAECYCRLADKALEFIGGPEPHKPGIDDYYRKQHSLYLQRALKEYEKLEDDLWPLLRAGTLSETDQAILRRASFAAAEIYYNLGDYTEALRRSKTLAERYSQRVECLTAYQIIFHCASALKQTEEARTALGQASAVLESALKGLPDNAFLRSAGTAQTRSEWSNWIQSRSAAFEKTAKPPATH